MDRKTYKFCAFALIAALAVPALAAPYPLTYSGRMTDSSGKPLSGNATIRVEFFRTAADTSALNISLPDIPVTLNDGLFQLNLALSAGDFHQVFNGTDAAWIQVTDVTRAKTYPRQSFSVVPYALKVPVDGTTIVYNADGELELGNVATAAHASTADSATTAASATSATTAATAGDFTGSLAGDVTGTQGATSVDKILGEPLDMTGISDGLVLKYVSGAWRPSTDATSGAGGEANDGASLGGSSPIYTGKTGVSLNFRGITAGTGVSVSHDANAVTVAATGAVPEARLLDADASHHIILKAPPTVTTSRTFTWPDVYGTGGHVLQTDGAGGLSWVPQPTVHMNAADKTKLDGIETAADVTDTANVTAAGAVMDGDFSANGILTRTNAGVYNVIPDASANWNDAHADRLKWDGGATGLSVAAAKASLGYGSMADQNANAVAITGGSLTGVTLTTPTFANDAISGDKVHGGLISSFASTGIDDNADSLAITINSAENVGLGTASPERRLHVVSSGANTRFEQDGSSGLNINTNPANIFIHSDDDAGGAKPLQMGASSALPHQLTLAASGNVGIGLLSPTAKLELGGVAGTDGIKFPDGKLQTTAAGQVATLHRSTAQSIPNNVTTAITFNTEEIDTDGYWSAGAPTRLTAPVAGVYLIGAYGSFDSNSTGKRRITLLVNGTGWIAASDATASNYSYLSTSMAYPMSAGDYVEAVVHQTSGAALNLTPWSRFFMIRIR